MGRPKGSTSKPKSGDFLDPWIDLIYGMSAADRAKTIDTMNGVHEALCRVEKKQPEPALPKERQQASPKEITRDAGPDLFKNNAATEEGL